MVGFQPLLAIIHLPNPIDPWLLYVTPRLAMLISQSE
jgi:hypothetical protein